MAEDPHGPTSAGPEPVPEPAGAVAASAFEADATAAQPPAPDPSPQPTPTVGASEAGYGQPAGSAMLGGGAVEDPHPEKLVGAAFAGGLVVAILLKGMARRKHA